MSEKTPRVFISSTHEDLEDFRAAASRGVNGARCLPVMTEYWRARGDKTSYEICFDKVRECDVLVVIVAHRYGWEPAQQPGEPEDRRSMVWLECQAARDAGKEVLAVVLHADAEWPPEKKDEHAIVVAMQNGTATADVFEKTKRKVKRQKDFREWLRGEGSGIVKYFKRTGDLKPTVEAAILAWKADAGLEATGTPAPLASVPGDYLEWVKGKYGTVEVLGQDSQDSSARLRQVYVPAVTHRPVDDGHTVDDTESGPEYLPVREGKEDRSTLLLNAIGNTSAYVPGAPGAGKSTFCRWLAWVIANGAVPSHPNPAPEDFSETLPAALAGKLPLLVELRDFWPHMSCGPGVRMWTRRQLETALASWLDETGPGELAGAAFKRLLAAGNVVLMLDGVDEVTTADRSNGVTTHPRACLLSALADALAPWQKAGNRVLLTSRPHGLTESELRRLEMPTLSLGPLPPPLQGLFIERWYDATDTGRREENTQGLKAQLATRKDLGELTASPLLLTALCIRFAQGQRLPDDLYELYDGLVASVLFNRYGEDSNERDRVRLRLSAIAYGMHSGTQERPRSTPAALVTNEEIEAHLREFAEENSNLEDALQKPTQRLKSLLARSGLLQAADADQVEFYHLSFQEFLSAVHLLRTRRADRSLLAALRERGAHKAWRPTLMFLFTGMVKRDPQWSLELLNALAEDLAREAVATNPSLAAFVAQCAEVLLKKRVSLGTLSDRLKRLCVEAIEDAVELKDRQVLGLALGRLGDPRLTAARDPAGFIEIPAGEYRDARGEINIIDKAFALGRYPVTNAQYAEFMQAKGYGNPAHWSREGAQWLEREDVDRPRYWDNSRFNAPNQPVVGVSFWEAQAYCTWARGRLPSDRQWGAAAGGPAGRVFPWGDEWTDGICNTLEAGLESTSPVGLFPRSRQADFGLEDVAGNVWEWCTPDRFSLDEGSDGDIRTLVLRGGAWRNTRDVARAGDRSDFHPDARDYSVGFRVLLSSPIS